ncbi:MAG: hypothetical protein IKU70_13340 [Clostridia bacterium]|nr:hypothetical protein [Clostridia bacterium]
MNAVLNGAEEYNKLGTAVLELIKPVGRNIVPVKVEQITAGNENTLCPFGAEGVYRWSAL